MLSHLLLLFRVAWWMESLTTYTYISCLKFIILHLNLRSPILHHITNHPPNHPNPKILNPIPPFLPWSSPSSNPRNQDIPHTHLPNHLFYLLAHINLQPFLLRSFDLLLTLLYLWFVIIQKLGVHLIRLLFHWL